MDPEKLRAQIYQETPGKVHMVLILLCVAYFGKYFCTSNLYVVQALFQMSENIGDGQLSLMFAFGYLASMAGKLTAGVLSDTKGGKFVMLMAVGGYAICTIAMSLVPSSYPVYFLVWCANGYFALGLAWVSVVAVATNWVPLKYMGRLMAIVSLAPQAGDMLARFVLSFFVGFGWRFVFQLAAIIALGLTIPVVLYVSSSPEGAKDEKKAKPVENVQEEETYLQKIRPLLGNPTLWLICTLSGAIYGTRTVFLLYATSFLARVHCQTEGTPGTECLTDTHTIYITGEASTVYTILGCVSVFLVGYGKDMLPKQHRASILAIPLFFLTVAMCHLALVGDNLSYGLAVSIVALTGFCLFGPYKILGAAFAVDIGGNKLKATACSFMGIFDNLFALIMLLIKGRLGSDWIVMFRFMAGLSIVSLLCSIEVWRRDLKRKKNEPSKPELKEPLNASSSANEASQPELKEPMKASSSV